MPSNLTQALQDSGKAIIQTVRDMGAHLSPEDQETRIVSAIERAIPLVVADCGLPELVGKILAFDPIVRLVYEGAEALLASELAAIEKAIGIEPAAEAIDVAAAEVPSLASSPAS